MTRILILGGARSGKSRRALQLAESMGKPCKFIATAEALDDEMSSRIVRHQAERSDQWETIEAPVDLVPALRAASSPDVVCVVDCLTLWLSNLMHHGSDIERESIDLCAQLRTNIGPVLLVSNEVGMGLVPETALGRAFRDRQGRLNQAVADVCDKVEFIVAGLPLTLKG